MVGRMLSRNTSLASFYIVLAFFSPQMTAILAIPLMYSGIMLYQLIQIILSVLSGIDDLTGNRLTGAIVWPFHLIANGTRVVTGTVPFPMLAFLAIKLPAAVSKITKKLHIKVKDIPKVLFNQQDRPNVRRWRRF